jgi:LmbE family N-acetylglucosaminyl deacetylase
MLIENAKRLLVFVAHPDDEIIGCGVLLQRVPTSLIVFAVDGAPTGYGFERKFGSLKKYSDKRFKEASCALALAGNCSFRRLNGRDGRYFPDRHLFEYLEEAADSLVTIARTFVPDAIVSHSFEGGHIDHDACFVLADHTAQTLSLNLFEFPLYWKSENGHDVFQKFRNPQEEETILNPSGAEMAIKNKMLGEYDTQRDILAVFSPDQERFRPARLGGNARPPWISPYPGNWRTRRDTSIAFERFSEFREHHTQIR